MTFLEFLVKIALITRFVHILPIVSVCIKGDNAQKQFHRAPFSTTQSDRIF